jgi:hypothetical protein
MAIFGTALITLSIPDKEDRTAYRKMLEAKTALYKALTEEFKAS